MSDYEVEIVKTPHETSHFHPELEIIFVIQGNVNVTIKSQKYYLRKEDIILVNLNELHTIKSDEDAIVYTLHFPWKFLKQCINDKNTLFDTDALYRGDEQNYAYQDMKKILCKLVSEYLKKTKKSKCMEESLIYQLLDCLIESYELINRETSGVNRDDDTRMNYVLDYIGKNYMEKISMSDLAEELHISSSTLSRMFKKQMGVHFVEYVNQLRIQYAIKEILYSDENITKIAMDCGFSNLAMFNKMFRKLYGMNPSEYRKDMGKNKKPEDQDNLENSVKEQLEKEFWQQINNDKEERHDNTEINIDIGQSEKYIKNWCKAINIGAVSNLTRANLQYHTLYLMEHLHIEYIRIWNIFSTRLQISDGKQTSRFNYDEIDQIFDFLVSNHVKLILDFGRRPDAAYKAEKEVLFWKEEYIKFQTKEAWEALLNDFVVHITKRYGKSVVKSWIYEFSYIEKHAYPYYEEKNYDFFEVYQYGYSIIKKYISTAEVGGFSGNVQHEYSYLCDFLKRCKVNSCIPDYLSFILFPYTINQNKFEKRLNETDYEEKSVQLMKQLLEVSGLEDKKIYIVEWNCSLVNRNILNDSVYRAGYFLKNITQIWNRADMFCLWMGSDWVSSYYDSVGLSYGGGGILTKDTIGKPTYHMLNFLNQLGDLLVYKNEYMIVTKREEEYYILCFNYKNFSSNYYLKEEDKITFAELSEVFENNRSLNMKIKLYNLPSNGTYVLKKRSINEQEGSLLAEWGKFQFDTELERSDVKYIKNACYPRITMEKREVEEDYMQIDIELKPQEIILLHIYQKD